MQLVEKHIITKKSPYFKEIDDITFLSKNLYNKANYIIRQEFIETSKQKEEGKVDHANWIRYNDIQKTLQNSKDVDYYAIPAKVSQQVLRTLDTNWKSFFQANKTYNKNKTNFSGRPKLPKYKDKLQGRNVLIYTIQAISQVQLYDGIIKLSGTSIHIKTKQTQINQVRIVPKNNHYTIEVVYTKQIKQYEKDKTRIAGGDLGLNNLVTVTSNQGVMTPLLINGKPLKSINQYYNKQKSKLQSYVGNKGTSNRIKQLTMKRNNKVDNYMHTASRIVVDYLVEHNIGVFVLGQNKQWKSEINIGSKNNQNFVGIPHTKFIQMIQYKCEMVGIEVILREESYTSKCSFIDNETIEKHDKYVGKRIKRGLFVSANGTLINADCNGSGNIIRKEFPNAFNTNGIEGVVVHPIMINLKRGYHYKQIK